jgi:hypothetical protein
VRCRHLSYIRSFIAFARKNSCRPAHAWTGPITLPTGLGDGSETQAAELRQGTQAGPPTAGFTGELFWAPKTLASYGPGRGAHRPGANLLILGNLYPLDLTRLGIYLGGRERVFRDPCTSKSGRRLAPPPGLAQGPQPQNKDRRSVVTIITEGHGWRPDDPVHPAPVGEWICVQIKGREGWQRVRGNPDGSWEDERGNPIRNDIAWWDYCPD